MFEMTLEKRYGTAVSTCTLARTVAERNQQRHVCQHLAAERPARVWHIAISIGALVISVPAQLLHGRRHILFDAVPWPPISWYHDACSWCATCATASIRFLDERGVARKKPGSFTFLLEAGNPYLEKVYKELTRDFEHLERSVSTKARLILTRNGELQIIFKDFENFIKRVDTTLFCGRSESYSELGIVATTRWGQYGRCRARIRSHLQDELSRPQSKLQVNRCCAAQNVTEKALRARGYNGVRSRLTKFGPSTLEKPDLKLNTGQLVIQHDCRSTHFSNWFSHFCVAGQRKPVQEHQVAVLLDTAAQIQERRFQETVEAYPCHRKGGSGRDKDPQGGKTLDMFLRARWKSRWHLLGMWTKEWRIR